MRSRYREPIKVMRSDIWKSRARALMGLVMVGFSLMLLQTVTWGISLSEKEAVAIVTGTTLIEKGAYGEAVSYFKDRLARPEIGPLERARIFHILGYLLLFAERMEQAIENGRAAHDWAMNLGLSAEAESFKTELAIQQAFVQALKLQSSGDISASNLKLEEADKLAGMIESRPYQLKILGAWGLNYVRSSEGQAKYLALSLRALELAESLHYRREASRAAKKVGAYFAIKSDYSRALSYFLKALNGLEVGGDDGDLIACLNNIAMIYMSLGDYIKSKDYLLDAASRIRKGSTGAFETSMLVNLGSLFSVMGKRLQLVDSQRKALDCFASYIDLQDSKSGGSFRLEALAGIAGVYLDQGRLEEARGILIPALEEARRKKGAVLTAGKILFLLGETSLRTGAISDAAIYIRETDSISRRTDSPLLAMNAAYGLGRCAEARGDFGQAIDSYNTAVSIAGGGFSNIFNDIHRADFIGRSREPFQALIQLYLRLSRREKKGVYEREIFRLSEYFRARSYHELQNRLFKDQARPQAASTGLERTKLNEVRIGFLKALSQAGLNESEREQLEIKIIQIDDMIDATIFNRYGEWDHLDPSLMPAPLNLLQSRILDDKTVILEYLLGETKSILFCISKDALHLIELPPVQAINDALTGFLSFLEDSSMPAVKGLPAAQRLYQVLLAPAEGFIPACVDRLIIVPDGILFRLPFEALVQPTPKTGPPIYVNDRFAVSYAPSASSLDLAATKQEGYYAKDALAYGVSEYPRPARRAGGSTFLSPSAILDDIYARRGFAIESIPYVKDEIADLARRFAPGKVDAFQGQRATKSMLKALNLESYRLIHLACHAFSDDNYPLRSALLMAPGVDDQEDGYLQASEIYDLRTKADLVVLSACRTGKGKVVMNEGNLGLPRVFFYMGAKSVLSTLWPVNDNSSTVFMKNFYDAYLRGEGKAESLRAAKKAMGETKYAHPFFWAPYVLTGGF